MAEVLSSSFGKWHLDPRGRSLHGWLEGTTLAGMHILPSSSREVMGVKVWADQPSCPQNSKVLESEVVIQNESSYKPCWASLSSS